MTIKRSLAALGLTITTLVLAACGGGGTADPLASSSAPPAASSSAGGTPIVVGGANFTESQVLAEIYAQALTAKGLQASTKQDLGSREVYLKALQEGSLQIVPEYTGNLLLFVDKNATATTQEELVSALPKALPSGLKIGKVSTAADQDVYVVTKDFSAKNNLTSLADLKNVSQNMVLGGPSELAQRPYGPEGLKGVYGATLKQFKPYNAPAIKTKDLLDGKIQLGEYFTTDSAIADNGFVPLADPQSMILPQNVVPLMSGAVADNPQVSAALDPVQTALTTEELTALNKQVDVDKMDPSEVAGAWLKSKGLA
jgi:osmoprotectant transport system substrate-binding protein